MISLSLPMQSEAEISCLKLEAAEYSKPALHAAFSEKYFADLLFSKASNISLPDVAPKGTLSGWVFDSRIPSNAAATVILPQDIIPHIDDLIPITRDMENTFLRGMCSVQLTLNLGECVVTGSFHFSKVFY